MFPTFPPWLEKLIVQAIKTYLPTEVVKEAFQGFLVQMCDWAKAQVANTANKIDDKIVEALADLVASGCTPDTAVLCDVISRGEAAVVDFLRAQAKRTDTKLDDTMVEVLAAALGVA